MVLFDAAVFVHVTCVLYFNSASSSLNALAQEKVWRVDR